MLILKNMGFWLAALALTPINSIFSKSIPFEIVNDLIIVEASINHGPSGKFILDTGAEDLFINNNSASQEESVAFQSLNGGFLSAPLGRLDLSIGEYLLDIKEAYQLDMQALEEFVNFPLLGLMGYKCLLENKMMIDFEDQQIIFLDDSSVASFDYDLPLGFWNGLPYLEIQEKNKKLRFLLDTGVSSHILNRSTLDQLKSDYEVVNTIELIDHVGNSKSIDRIRIPSLGCFFDKEATFLLESLELDEEEKIDGILNPGLLGISHILLDFEKGICSIRWSNPSISCVGN